MDSVAGPQIQKLRCSPFHSALEVDPIGSAAAYDAYVCVEVPLPWQRDITLSEPFASLCDPPAASLKGADGRRWRPQGLVPRAIAGVNIADLCTDDPGSVHVVAWEREAGPGNSELGDGNRAAARPLRRRDWLVEPGRERDLVTALLAADEVALGSFGAARVVTDRAAFYVCTHGQRDVCCGSMGAELFGRLPDADALPGVEIRRCSHTGGHRFAATAISFPDGYSWAHLDQSLVQAVSSRSVAPAELARHMRGSTLLPSGPPQVADRHALCEVGWAWADAAREVELIGFERRTMATDLRITGRLPDGSKRAFEVRVGIETHVPQITCGAISEPEYKVEPVWRVEAAREIALPGVSGV